MCVCVSARMGEYPSTGTVCNHETVAVATARMGISLVTDVLVGMLGRVGLVTSALECQKVAGRAELRGKMIFFEKKNLSSVAAESHANCDDNSTSGCTTARITACVPFCLVAPVSTRISEIYVLN